MYDSQQRNVLCYTGDDNGSSKDYKGDDSGPKKSHTDDNDGSNRDYKGNSCGVLSYTEDRVLNREGNVPRHVLKARYPRVKPRVGRSCKYVSHPRRVC